MQCEWGSSICCNCRTFNCPALTSLSFKPNNKTSSIKVSRVSLSDASSKLSSSTSSFRLSLWSLFELEVLEPLPSELFSTAVRLRTNPPELDWFIFLPLSTDSSFLTFHCLQKLRSRPPARDVLQFDFRFLVFCLEIFSSSISLREIFIFFSENCERFLWLVELDEAGLSSKRHLLA